MTIALYARRKAWQLTGVTVRLRHSRIHADDCAECETQQACSIGSRARSRSPASLRRSSVLGYSRSPTSVRSIGPSPRRSTFGRLSLDDAVDTTAELVLADVQQYFQHAGSLCVLERHEDIGERVARVDQGLDGHPPFREESERWRERPAARAHERQLLHHDR